MVQQQQPRARNPREAKKDFSSLFVDKESTD